MARQRKFSITENGVRLHRNIVKNSLVRAYNLKIESEKNQNIYGHEFARQEMNIMPFNKADIASLYDKFVDDTLTANEQRMVSKIFELVREDDVKGKHSIGIREVIAERTKEDLVENFFNNIDTSEHQDILDKFDEMFNALSTAQKEEYLNNKEYVAARRYEQSPIDYADQNVVDEKRDILLQDIEKYYDDHGLVYIKLDR